MKPTSTSTIVHSAGWPVVDADKIAHQLLADPTGLERPVMAVDGDGDQQTWRVWMCTHVCTHIDASRWYT